MTQEAPKVYEAVSAVMAEMSKVGIAKDRKNQQQGYAFRGIDDVYAALASVLSTHKLMLFPFVVEMKREERQTAKGGIINYTILTVDYEIVCALDGSKQNIRMIGEAMDSADKSSNKAMSAALKYAALQVFMIPTEGNNDADAVTHELAVQTIDKYQVASLESLIEEVGADKAKFLAHIKLNALEEIPVANLDDAVKILRKKAKPKAQPTQENGKDVDLVGDYVPY